MSRTLCIITMSHVPLAAAYKSNATTGKAADPCDCTCALVYHVIFPALGPFGSDKSVKDQVAAGFACNDPLKKALVATAGFEPAMAQN